MFFSHCSLKNVLDVRQAVPENCLEADFQLVTDENQVEGNITDNKRHFQKCLMCLLASLFCKSQKKSGTKSAIVRDECIIRHPFFSEVAKLGSNET